MPGAAMRVSRKEKMMLTGRYQLSIFIRGIDALL